MKKHSHLNSDLSAVFYLKVDKATDYKSGLKIQNVLKNIEIYNYSDKKKLFKKTTNKNKSFIIKPKRNESWLYIRLLIVREKNNFRF